MSAVSEFMAKNGRKGAKARWAKTDAKGRSEYARMMAKARWAKKNVQLGAKEGSGNKTT